MVCQLIALICFKRNWKLEWLFLNKMIFPLFFVHHAWLYSSPFSLKILTSKVIWEWILTNKVIWEWILTSKVIWEWKILTSKVIWEWKILTSKVMWEWMESLDLRIRVLLHFTVFSVQHEIGKSWHVLELILETGN